jgi:hypothetical protein
LIILLNSLAESVDEPQSPNTVFSGSSFSAAPSKPMSSQALAASQKPNKGVILAKSVDYMKHLKHLVELQHQRIKELESGHPGSSRQLALGNFDPGVNPSSSSPSPHSGSSAGNEQSLYGSLGLHQLDVKPYIIDNMVVEDD